MVRVLRAIWESLEILLGLSALVYISWEAMTGTQQKKLISSVTNVVRAGIHGAIVLLHDAEPYIEPIVVEFAASIKKYGKTIARDLKDPAADMAQFALKTATNSLETKTNIKPADWSSIAGDAMADAFGFGLASFSTAAAFEAVFPEKLNTLNGLAPMLATLSGFDEVTKAALRPVLINGIAVPAGYDSNSKFRSRLPAQALALSMYSRRKITAGELETLLGFAGLSPDWTAPVTADAFKPIQPRALATAIQDTPFPHDQMLEVLQDNGYSDAHAQFMLDLLEYNSTKNLRNAYVSEAVLAYKDGVMADSELDDILTSVGWSDQAKQFVRSRALLQRRVTLAQAAEKQIAPQIVAGVISEDVGLQQLEAAGIQPWYAELQSTLAGVRATIAAAKKTLREEQKLELARQRNLTRAAVAEYQRGVLDEAGLTAALLLLGLDPTLIGSIVAVQNATRTGRLRLLYGQLLLPADAKLLEERISAITTQLKEQLLTIDQARAQLAGLKIDKPDVDAILARAAASHSAASTRGTLVNPLTG